MGELDDEAQTLLKASMKRCGICNVGPMYNWARRVGQVCPSCEARAVDSKSNRIFIAQLFKEEEGYLYIQNPKAYFGESEAAATLPLTPCDEVSNSRRCWVDGIECLIWEGRFGGIGLVVQVP
jgi:hypothetical protein